NGDEAHPGAQGADEHERVAPAEFHRGTVGQMTDERIDRRIPHEANGHRHSQERTRQTQDRRVVEEQERREAEGLDRIAQRADAVGDFRRKAHVVSRICSRRVDEVHAGSSRAPSLKTRGERKRASPAPPADTDSSRRCSGTGFPVIELTREHASSDRLGPLISWRREIAMPVSLSTRLFNSTAISESIPMVTSG